MRQNPHVAAILLFYQMFALACPLFLACRTFFCQQKKTTTQNNRQSAHRYTSINTQRKHISQRCKRSTCLPALQQSASFVIGAPPRLTGWRLQCRKGSAAKGTFSYITIALYFLSVAPVLFSTWNVRWCFLPHCFLETLTFFSGNVRFEFKK